MAFRWMEKRVTQVFNNAGILLDDDDSPYNIQLVKPDKFFRAVALRGHDGFADAYMKGYWECTALDQCVFKLLSSGAIDSLRFHPSNLRLCVSDLFRNKQKPGRAQRNVSHHYNRGAVFEVMLDRTRSYSCGHWALARNLEDAQIAKLDLVCLKLGLKPGMSFCDIGCGWGALLRHAAKKYGCASAGITLSTDQRDYIGSPDFDSPEDVPLTARLDDYRNLHGQYDRIASVGMFEHVGRKNARNFMRCVDRYLKPGGLFLLHTIASRHSSPSLNHPELPWIEKNIFPGGSLLSMGQITTAAQGIFKVLDQENFGPYYDLTLMEWAKNFKEGWESIKSLYSEEFYRMWLYYLYSCAAGFRSGRLELFQIVLAKPDWQGLYRGVRFPVQSPIAQSVLAK